MVPNKDLYADKHGKITDDPEQYATQVAVKGVFLDERIARRYGIADMLVSTDEPNARRRVSGGASVQILKADEKQEEAAQAEKPETDEPEAEPKAAASKKTVAKEEGDKKK